MTASDTPPEGTPGPAPDPAAEPLEEGSSPYKNLWVPLVVVPALVVMVLLAVAAFFGLAAGEESSIEDNLHDVVHGGSNERTQAVFNLSRQVAENAVAAAEGRDRPWEVPPGFVRLLEDAWEELDEDDWEIKQVFAYLMATEGDEGGVTRLMELLSVPEGEDPDGRIRFSVIVQLGQLGDDRAAPRLIEFLDDSDDGLRAAAAIALQTMPGAEARGALEGALGDDDFDVRGNAAISLSHLGGDAGAELLRELAGREAYEEQHRLDRKRYHRANTISESRVRAIQALARLRRSDDRAFFEVLRNDDDYLVREAAMVALREEEH